MHDNGTIGVRHPNPQKPRPQSIVVTPLRKLVVPGNINRTLTLLKCMEQIKRGQKSVRNSIFQVQNITNPTVTPEDAVAYAAQQLTASIKVNLTIAIYWNEIYQLNK